MLGLFLFSLAVEADTGHEATAGVALQSRRWGGGGGARPRAIILEGDDGTVGSPNEHKFLDQCESLGPRTTNSESTSGRAVGKLDTELGREADLEAQLSTLQRLLMNN